MSPYNLSDYDYVLPPELVAQYPAEARGSSRLLVLDRKSCAVTDACFADIQEYIPAGALFVANNSRVAQVRLHGRRAKGGKAELLLLTPPPILQKISEEADGWCQAEATALLKPGKAIQVGDRLGFGFSENNALPAIYIDVLRKHAFGRHDVNIRWQGDLSAILENRGVLPLPPYIKHTPKYLDNERYQTVYSRMDKAGSIAAPTAGLHFTEDMRNLIKKEFAWVEVTLHVGYGTFNPVRDEDIRRHHMHGEFVEITAQTVQAVLNARQDGRPILAVGTTTARALEGMANACGGDFTEISNRGWSGWTDIFIYPGYKFQIVDAMLTNFHLPKSSLLMLVSALAGRDAVLAAYRHAVIKLYRFFSYGDAMLIA